MEKIKEKYNVYFLVFDVYKKTIILDYIREYLKSLEL